MTPQEAFDSTVRHLKAQGCAATNDAGTCVYRSPTGLKCAMGFHIPDELYNPEFEGKSASYVIDHLHLDYDPRLMDDLQIAHDYCITWDEPWADYNDKNPDGIAARLALVAHRHGLSNARVLECWPQT